MLRRLLTVLIFLPLSSGCATLWSTASPETMAKIEAERRAQAAAVEAAQAERQAAAAAVPQCSKEPECSRMWAAAQAWVARNSGWKVQTLNDGYLETFNPAPHSPRIAARVVKEPIPGGAYRLVLTVWCNNIFGCAPPVIDALGDFNRSVAAAVQ